MALIVPVADKKKLPDWVPPAKNGTSSPANKGSLEANLVALGECQTAQEQKDLILAMLGDLSSIVVPLGNRLLVTTYVRPQRSAGGIIFTDKKRDSNRYEGKVGLVIAVGPTAFRYDGAYPWEGPKPSVGDWIWYRASDAPERGIRNVYCRMIEDDRVEGITDDPLAIY